MDLPTELTNSITAEYECISIKINYLDDEYDASDNQSPPDNFYAVQAYLNELKIDILYSSCGLHLNGKNKIPHIHYALICKNIPKGTFVTANSTHRKRWLAKNEDFNFEGVSFSFPKKENPVWQILSYPLKEGHAIPKGILMATKYLDFVTAYGKNLYQVSLGNHARQDACEERKKVALLSLAKLCEDNKSEFSSYREMVIWLDTNYIDKLSLEEKPDPRNYKTNCQKICVHLGKLKYSDIV